MINEILKTKGKIFSVVFIKKNGDKRKMHCRLGVKRYLNGGKNINPKIGQSQLIVWDLKNQGYRTININTITKFNFKGK